MPPDDRGADAVVEVLWDVELLELERLEIVWGDGVGDLIVKCSVQPGDQATGDEENGEQSDLRHDESPDGLTPNSAARAARPLECSVRRNSMAAHDRRRSLVECQPDHYTCRS